MNEAPNNDIFQSKQPSRLEGMSKQLGFDIPVESVSLPSEGKLYAPTHPFHGLDSVEVRSMTAREEDLLTSTALHKSGMVINKLVEACLLNKSVDIDSLLTGDRDALLIAIRIIGYGSEYKVKLICPECDASFPHTFQLNKLTIKHLGAEPMQPGINRFAYTLPLSKLTVDFKLMTCGDERDLTNQEERKKKILDSQIEGRITSRLAASIIAVNGEEDRGKITKIATNLRAGDSRALRGYINKIDPKIDMSQDTKCTKCNTTSEVDVPLTSDFFWPEFDD